MLQRVCEAHDAASYVACMTQVEDDIADVVWVKSTIKCSVPSVCWAPVTNPGRPIAVIGTAPGAGFHRTTDYGYALIKVCPLNRIRSTHAGPRLLLSRFPHGGRPSVNAGAARRGSEPASSANVPDDGAHQRR